MRLLSKVCLAIAIAAGICTPAYAYVDPNAGGLLFQLLAPIIALAAAGLTFARQRLSRAWESLSDGIKALVARFFRA